MFGIVWMFLVKVPTGQPIQPIQEFCMESLLTLFQVDPWSTNMFPSKTWVLIEDVIHPYPSISEYDSLFGLQHKPQKGLSYLCLIGVLWVTINAYITPVVLGLLYFGWLIGLPHFQKSDHLLLEWYRQQISREMQRTNLERKPNIRTCGNKF